MQVTLHSTTKTVFLNGVECRIWEGETANGVACHAYITRIAVAKKDDAAEFERDLKEHAAPTPEIQAIPLRMVL